MDEQLSLLDDVEYFGYIPMNCISCDYYYHYTGYKLKSKFHFDFGESQTLLLKFMFKSAIEPVL